MVASRGYDITGNTGVYYMMVIREVFIGLYIGFLVSLMFSAFQLAGQYFSVQTGFGINEVLDPLSQISMPLIGQLKNLVGLLVFLSMNGHHLLIDGIYRSYELVPLVNTGRPAMGKLVEYMMYCFNGMFVVALKIALPVMGTLFLITVAMGVLSKAAPQMNIMMMGFPVNIVASIGIMFMITPLIVRIMNVSLERTFGFILKMMHYWPH